ncbi:MAG TPA: sensor domain-containing diguanylate cyclase [Candidatus Limnocylindrales bacterium]|nr:sensor domain-containing diguanylate cyclase [Candidatus Limnocylindrales bacterium]
MYSTEIGERQFYEQADISEPGHCKPVETTDNDRQLSELKIFHDVAKALTSTLDLDTILQTIMEKMAAYFEPATWSLVMIDESTQEPYYAASVGRGSEGFAALRLSDGATLTEWVIAHGEALVIENVNADPLIDPDSRSEWFDGSCSVVCMPVRTGGKVLGVIQLVNIDLQVYARSEMLLRTLADYAAIAIENARAVRRIQELSITDDCTGLYNARHLFTVLSDEVNRSARFGYEFTLLFLDLDHFKRVNDEHGHLIGSKLLAQVGECLRENLRLVDAAFRYGGDEFAILLPQTSREAGLRVARRISRVFHQRRWLLEDKIGVDLRASIGIATYPAEATTPQTIVQRADEMMYTVKQAGRDNIAVSRLGIVGLEEDRAAG